MLKHVRWSGKLNEKCVSASELLKQALHPTPAIGISNNKKYNFVLGVIFKLFSRNET
jgi:hypothetical protein